MTKLEFIFALSERLSGLPERDVVERINFYTEMIEDRVEDGLSEDEAVAAIGEVDAIAEQIASELGAKTENKSAYSHSEKKKLRALEITLLIVGAPVWFSLLIGIIAIVISLYAALWSVVISLWAVFASFFGCAIGGIIGGTLISITSSVISGIALISGALVCAGLSVFTFYASASVTKLSVRLTNAIYKLLRSKLIKKEANR